MVTLFEIALDRSPVLAHTIHWCPAQCMWGCFVFAGAERMFPSVGFGTRTQHIVTRVVAESVTLRIKCMIVVSISPVFPEFSY